MPSLRAMMLSSALMMITQGGSRLGGAPHHGSTDFRNPRVATNPTTPPALAASSRCTLVRPIKRGAERHRPFLEGTLRDSPPHHARTEARGAERHHQRGEAALQLTGAITDIVLSP